MRRYVGQRQFSIGSQPRCLSPRLKPTAAELQALVKQQAARAKTHAKGEAERSEPKVSVNDPAARLMRLADSALAPAWECPSGDQQRLYHRHRSDQSAQGRRIGAGIGRDNCRALWRVPQRLLADTTVMPQEDIVKTGAALPRHYAAARSAPKVTAETLRKRRWRRRHQPGDPGVAVESRVRKGNKLPAAQGDRTGP